MRIGIRNGSLKMDWQEAVATAGELRFDSVELNIGADYAEGPMAAPDGASKLAEAATASGCEIASFCVGALWGISPASPDAAVRAQARDALGRTAAFAADTGARWILVPVTPGGEGVDHEQSVSRWIDEMRIVAPVAEECGVVFCLENVGRGCGKSATDLLRLTEGVESPAVGAYYDIGNAVAFGNDPVAEIAHLGDTMRIVHVKDHGDLLGAGDVPIRACIEALVGGGYDGYLVLETAPTNDPRYAATYNLGFLRGVLASV